MHKTNLSNWQQRVDQVWGDASISDEARVSAIADLAAELSASDPRGPFELGERSDRAAARCGVGVIDFKEKGLIGLDDQGAVGHPTILSG